MAQRKNFPDAVILKAVKATETITAAAKELTQLGRGKVSRQTLSYWLLHMDNDVAEDVLESEDFAKSEGAKRTAQLTNNHLRKINRQVLDAERTKDEVLQGVEQAVAVMKDLPPINLVKMPKPVDGKKMTVEALFSDLQIGKLMDNYTTDISIKRMKEYTEVLIEKIYQHTANGYDIERIMFCMLGDIIESDKKHANSARACDSGTAEQMQNAIQYIYKLVIEPLASLGIPMDVICITGNHDHDGHGLEMFQPGKTQLSWPMYHSMRMIAEARGLGHVKFHIPEGAFHVNEIYGNHVLYEHGVGVGANPASMSKRVVDRTKQLHTYIDLYRMGDKHHICRFNNDKLIVNGAFFGDDRTGSEYSGICGYDGNIAQLVLFHVERKDVYRTSIFDTLAIQLGHIV
ncbi:metallo-dependent phosphatase-like protein [Vibrio phage 1.204.O._10N.222.46.F12]|uniref:Metallo-dependent phosphatase-like protein n=1 Tax=Vibrio phage 1.204.O._10N.222.46.F12 TaxID=1881263 RepID=A0A2I7RNM8_9CAUD|nr:metallo-dependent phosphatase-like protein [Vibrio phage 1.204.O._10N.222.46.F12]AUR95250.1 metallo-dependent phosphatase-like protein [Vibrio phage 1.204.O._10N.222.46.F12]